MLQLYASCQVVIIVVMLICCHLHRLSRADMCICTIGIKTPVWIKFVSDKFVVVLLVFTRHLSHQCRHALPSYYWQNSVQQKIWCLSWTILMLQLSSSCNGCNVPFLESQWIKNWLVQWVTFLGCCQLFEFLWHCWSCSRNPNVWSLTSCCHCSKEFCFGEPSHILSNCWKEGRWTQLDGGSVSDYDDAESAEDQRSSGAVAGDAGCQAARRRPRQRTAAVVSQGRGGRAFQPTCRSARWTTQKARPVQASPAGRITCTVFTTNYNRLLTYLIIRRRIKFFAWKFRTNITALVLILCVCK